MTRDAVVTSYTPIVSAEARKLSAQFPGASRQDLEQEGLLELLGLANAYDETRAATFGAYVRKSVRGRMLDYLTGGGRDRQLGPEIDPPAKVVSIDTAMARRERDGQLTHAVEKLTPRQRSVIELRRQGLTQTEVGARLGVSQEAARRLERRAVGRIQKEILSAA